MHVVACSEDVNPAWLHTTRVNLYPQAGRVVLHLDAQNPGPDRHFNGLFVLDFKWVFPDGFHYITFMCLAINT